MPHINILPRSVADLIAAGEVVERPASAVKELVENAIDAGATKIAVEIQNGGVRYIRVTDDGCGIAPEDVPKAFVSHATSKIAAAEDLDAILTLGFRGEALSSIASVARVEMLTKTADEPFGVRYAIEGGKELLADPAGCPDGTTIVVRDLFYNTPARMKFLKRDATEGSYVSDVVTRIALAHPEISFRLIRDGRQTLFTSGDGKTSSVLSALFGAELRDGMLPCSCSADGVAVEGWISRPDCCRPTRNLQYFFVNSRSVRIPMGAAALDNAYKNSVMTGRFPACALNITVPPGTVDVNVHPAKTEVRFSDEKRIYNLLYSAVKSALETDRARPSLSLDEIVDAPAPLSGEQTRMDMPSPGADASATPEKTALNDVGEVPFNERWMPAKQTPVTVYEPGDGSFLYAASPEATGVPETGPVRETAQPSVPETEPCAPAAPPAPYARGGYVNIDIEYDEPPTDGGSGGDPCGEAKADVSEGEEKTAAPESEENAPRNETTDERQDTPYFVYLGEIFKTYLLAQYDDRLLIVDKHALHERMLYDEIRARGACTARQTLLAPQVVQLNIREYAAALDEPEALERLGFSFSDLGDGALLVREIPMMFSGEDIASVLSELADGLLSHSSEPTTEKLEWLYHSASCRAAVKGGSDITKEDAVLLIGKVLRTPSLRCCPHGRPVLIELGRKELEKRFGRIQ